MSRIDVYLAAWDSDHRDQAETDGGCCHCGGDNEPVPDGVGQAVAAALETAVWSGSDGHDDNGRSLKDAGWGVDDIADEAVEELARQVADFWHCNRANIAVMLGRGFDAGSVGHNFVLTRNREGAGFWDLGLGEVGEVLTGEANAWGEWGLYIGDDGLLHGA